MAVFIATTVKRAEVVYDRCRSRMHSSRMHTTRLLTVFRSALDLGGGVGGVFLGGSMGGVLALKPRDVTRSPKQGYHWLHKKDLCPPKIFENIE